MITLRMRAARQAATSAADHPAGLRQRAEGAAGTLPPLLVAAERVAATVAQGVHGRRRTGQGETFWQFRQYRPGESAGHVDWRKSARSDRLYVRESEWEAAQSVWLWRDGSASMDYASAPGGETKRHRAELILLATASLLIRGGERVALMGSVIRPSSGRAALNRLAQMLGADAASSPPTPSLADAGKAEAGLPEFETLPRAAQLVLIGDFLSSLDSLNRAATRLAGLGVKGYLLQIADPAEEDLPFEGRVRFEGLEIPETLIVSRVETIRDAYAERYLRHKDGVAAIARALGWGYGFHRTDRPPHAALLALHGALTADRRR